ncbi:thioredoxin family protein [Kitasatospora sp. NPDC096140]|uniref:thioredoxin family protein n=1 Tax=Kitasatospora sp. NPDC096140 TaxID=3155425 RepID=UPI00332D6FA5
MPRGGDARCGLRGRGQPMYRRYWGRRPLLSEGCHPSAGRGHVGACSASATAEGGGMVKRIEGVAEFDELLASGSFLVVHFTAAGSGASCEMAPLFERQSEENPSVEFVAVDIAALPEIGERYGVRTLPTFVIFKGEHSRDSVIGPNQGALRAMLRILRKVTGD